MSRDAPRVWESLTQGLDEWMSYVGFDHWLRLGAALGLTVDALIEGLFAGRLASMPGQVRGKGVLGIGGFDNVDALALIGRDRRIVRAFGELPESYARRLRLWRQTWASASVGFGFLEQVRPLLGPTPPRIRQVDQNGTWHSILSNGDKVLNTRAGDGFKISAATGALTAEPGISHPWDWDSAEPGAPITGRVWLIIYAPTSPQIEGTGGLIGDGRVLGTPDATIGTTATPGFIGQLQGVAADALPAGIVLDHVIVAFNPSSFNPLQAGPYPAAGFPDGHWRYHGRSDAGAPGAPVFRNIARNRTARYFRSEFQP